MIWREDGLRNALGLASEAVKVDNLDMDRVSALNGYESKISNFSTQKSNIAKTIGLYIILPIIVFVIICVLSVFLFRKYKQSQDQQSQERIQDELIQKKLDEYAKSPQPQGSVVLQSSQKPVLAQVRFEDISKVKLPDIITDKTQLTANVNAIMDARSIEVDPESAAGAFLDKLRICNKNLKGKALEDWFDNISKFELRDQEDALCRAFETIRKSVIKFSDSSGNDYICTVFIQVYMLDKTIRPGDVIDAITNGEDINANKHQFC